MSRSTDNTIGVIIAICASIDVNSTIYASVKTIACGNMGRMHADLCHLQSFKMWDSTRNPPTTIGET